MDTPSSENEHITIIEPASGWELPDFKELKAYRDLFYFLVWRDIKVLYAQTILGFSWALINPIVQIVIFSVIFGTVANIASDGIPYVLFATVAIIPWTYISESMGASSQSLVGGQNMLGKVYFPRLIFPLTPILAKLVDFSISMMLIVAVMIYYRISPTWNLAYFPLLVVLMMIIPAGVGLWLSSLAIRYRDLKFAMPFMIRMLLYSAPIIYPASAIPEQYRFVYSLNPIVAVIEGYRACLLGTPMPWQYILPGSAVAILVLFFGAIYFRKMERVFVDVI
jgi:lipopolysaccharide transport system permease protein